MARIVATGVPHHVTQRGHRRQKVFFSDYECYRAMLLGFWGHNTELMERGNRVKLAYRSLAKRKPGPKPAAMANRPTL